MQKKYFIFAMSGTGKTYITHKYKNAVELEFLDFKWIYEGEHNNLTPEEKKGYPHRVRNTDYPQNMMDAVFKSFSTHDVVMVTLLYEQVAMLIDALTEKKDITVIFAYPKPECYDEYKQRWISRGNTNFFLAVMEDAFRMPIRFFQNLTGYQHLVLDSGEFLDEVLEKFGIPLIHKG